MNVITIDMDYFNHLRDEYEIVLDFLLSIEKPLHFITNHQQALYWLNHQYANADEVINIDYHSDISYDPFELNCGTWVNFIKNKRKYLWVHPHEKDEITCGECSFDWPIFPRTDSEVTDNELGFSSVRSQQFFSMEWFKRKIRDSMGIIVCRSPLYTADDIQDWLKDFLKKHDLKILRGRLNEDYGMRKIPKKPVYF